MALTRRFMLTGIGTAASAVALGGSPLQSSGQRPVLPSVAPRKLKVMVTGGHPDDPEAGCGGSIARYADLGHDVVLVYLNRGQGYCAGATGEACGEVRSAEAGKACGILGARLIFMSQYDGRAIVDSAHYDEFAKILNAEEPDLLFAQWPIDTHRDHRALSSIVLDAWLLTQRKASFYFYEVAEDTLVFSPTNFVDVTSVVPRKRSACFAHMSQGPERWYALQEQLTRVRGAVSGCAQSEAFVRHWHHSDTPLL